MVSLPPCKFEPENRENKAQCVPVFKELTKSIFFFATLSCMYYFWPTYFKIGIQKSNRKWPIPSTSTFL